MNTPSLEEQLFVEAYVLDRPIYRPDADIKKAVKCILLYITATFLVAVSVYFVLSKLGAFSFLPNTKLFDYLNSHKPLRFFVCVILCFFATGILCLRAALIGAIRLYQRYADEEVRRRCVCKPTCSEYAILVLKRYGLLIGLCKIYIRLFITCRGTVYKIDEPALFGKRKKRAGIKKYDREVYYGTFQQQKPE